MATDSRSEPQAFVTQVAVTPVGVWPGLALPGLWNRQD